MDARWSWEDGKGVQGDVLDVAPGPPRGHGYHHHAEDNEAATLEVCECLGASDRGMEPRILRTP